MLTFNLCAPKSNLLILPAKVLLFGSNLWKLWTNWINCWTNRHCVNIHRGWKLNKDLLQQQIEACPNANLQRLIIQTWDSSVAWKVYLCCSISMHSVTSCFVFSRGLKEIQMMPSSVLLQLRYTSPDKTAAELEIIQRRSASVIHQNVGHLPPPMKTNHTLPLASGHSATSDDKT